MPGAPLELHEREEIFRALVEDLQAGWAAIGRRVGRHPTTVAREINAGGGRERYGPAAAQRRAEVARRRARRRRLEAPGPLRRGPARPRRCSGATPGVVRAATGWDPQRRDHRQGRAADLGSRPRWRCTTSGCAKGRCVRTGSHRGRAPPPRRPVRWRRRAALRPRASTARFAVCQSQPNSAATSAPGRASRPTATVAQRPARAVSAARAGAICSSTSVNVPTTQFAAGQRHRHLCHTRRTGRPNTGRSTNPTRLVPFDHTDPPQPPHGGRGAPLRMCTPNGPPGASSTPRTSTSPRPTSNSQIRVGFSSTGGLLRFGVCQPRFWRPPPHLSRTQCPLISEEPGTCCRHSRACDSQPGGPMMRPWRTCPK